MYFIENNEGYSIAIFFKTVIEIFKGLASWSVVSYSFWRTFKFQSYAYLCILYITYITVMDISACTVSVVSFILRNVESNH